MDRILLRMMSESSLCIQKNGGAAEGKKDSRVLHCSYFETFVRLFIKAVKKLEHVRILSCNHMMLKDITEYYYFMVRPFMNLNWKNQLLRSFAF